MTEDDRPAPEELRDQQAAREAEEAACAAEADAEEERLAAARRAEKAAYLKEKLDEQVEREA